MANPKSFKIRLVGKPGKIFDKNRILIEKLDRHIFRGIPKYNNFEKCYWWVVYWGKMPVAYCGMDISWTSSYLCRAGVLKAARGKGLQKRLIRVRERMARKLGFKRMTTYTHKTNKYSLANLTSLGYKKFKPTKPWGDPPSQYSYLFKIL